MWGQFKDTTPAQGLGKHYVGTPTALLVGVSLCVAGVVPVLLQLRLRPSRLIGKAFFFAVCPGCNHVIPSAARYCAYCGRRQGGR